jgi:hypothetical protein
VARISGDHRTATFAKKIPGHQSVHPLPALV